MKNILLAVLLSGSLAGLANAQTMTVSYQEGQVLDMVVPELLAEEGARERFAAYVDTVFPLAQPFGHTPSATLLVKGVLNGDYHPNAVALASWPNADAVASFEALPEWPPLKATRPEIWNEFKAYSVVLDTDVSFELNAEKTYTIGFAWINPENPTDYESYLSGAHSALKASGGKVVWRIKDPDFSSLQDGATGPGKITLVEWDSPSGPQDYLKTEGFQSNVHYFNSGTTKLEWLLVAPVISDADD